MGRFTEGKQPCNLYDPHDCDAAGALGLPNEHECYAPTLDGCRCADHGGRVSSCKSCGKDHHSGGYESCMGDWSLEVGHE